MLLYSESSPCRARSRDVSATSANKEEQWSLYILYCVCIYIIYVYICVPAIKQKIRISTPRQEVFDMILTTPRWVRTRGIYFSLFSFYLTLLSLLLPPFSRIHTRTHTANISLVYFNSRTPIDSSAYPSAITQHLLHIYFI
jgi:hypothetical protein